MRTFPSPLRVTLLPPSMTSLVPLSLKTFAVCARTIVTGSGPQSKVMTPPFATAATNASPVQPAALPDPTTVVGDDTSSAWPSAGMVAWPSGYPAGGPSCGLVGGVPEVPAVPGAPAVPCEPPVPGEPAAPGEPTG